MKKWVTLFVFILVTSAVFFSMNTQAAANSKLDSVKLMIEGSYREPEVPARITEGRTFVPLRFIAENMGANVHWDSKTSGIEIMKGRNKLHLTLGSKQINVNGNKKAMDIAPYTENGRTLVPIRFISEYLGYRVGWESNERYVIVSHPVTFTLNGQALTKAYEPIKVHNETYFPIFELAKHLNVQVVEQGDSNIYSFVYQVQPPIHTASQSSEEHSEEEEEAGKTEAVTKSGLNKKQESQDLVVTDEESANALSSINNDSLVESVTNLLPASEIITIDGVKMVPSKWVDVLLGTTSTWDTRRNILEISKKVKSGQLDNVVLEKGVFSLQLTDIKKENIEHFFLGSPHRLVIDLPQTVLGSQLYPNYGSERVIPIQYGTVDQVRVGQFSIMPKTVRVVFDLNHRSSVKIEEVGENLNISFEKRNPLVVIDPGHGGKDPGAVGKISNEATIVLSVSQKISKLLEEDPDIDVLMTRSDNTFISLDERVEIANDARADMFMSVHANAINRASVGGTETFVDNNADKTFGTIVHKHLLEATGLTNRGLKEAGFRVLKGTKMPAVLIEMAFVSNQSEEKLLNDPAFQDKVALAMYNAIREYEFGK
jgi:N-acetylmuramoyl-L-alanine amidase